MAVCAISGDAGTSKEAMVIRERRGRIRRGMWCVVSMAMSMILMGCTAAPQEMSRLTYVRLVPSLPSMSRILSGSLDYLYDPIVGTSTVASGCTELDDTITDGLAVLAIQPSLKGVQVSFSYGDTVRVHGDVLVVQSPFTDQEGLTHDLMAAARHYPCHDLLDVGSMSASSAAVSHTGTISAAAMVQGLPYGMVGYWNFTTPDVSDPAFATSDPVSSLGEPGTLDLFATTHGFVIRVRLEGFSPDPSQSLMSMDSVLVLVRAISDRVSENRYTVAAMDSPGTCGEVLGRFLEKDPAFLACM